jgi:hypothetical protein
MGRTSVVLNAQPLTCQSSRELHREELAVVDGITERYGRASETVCEWCGRLGSLRSDGPEWMTLCDRCAEDMKSTKYPSQRSIV